MLIYDPAVRISAKDAINHEYFKDVNVSELPARPYSPWGSNLNYLNYLLFVVENGFFFCVTFVLVSVFYFLFFSSDILSF